MTDEGGPTPSTEPAPAGHLEETTLPARTNEPYDAPAAADLIEAVAEYLRTDLLPRAEGHDRWTLRIAANALTIAAREINLAPSHRANYHERMDILGFDSERALSEAIRSGDVDDQWDDVVDAVFSTVCDSLAVANPQYLEPEDQP